MQEGMVATSRRCYGMIKVFSEMRGSEGRGCDLSNVPFQVNYRMARSSAPCTSGT